MIIGIIFLFYDTIADNSKGEPVVSMKKTKKKGHKNKGKDKGKSKKGKGKSRVA